MKILNNKLNTQVSRIEAVYPLKGSELLFVIPLKIRVEVRNCFLDVENSNRIMITSIYVRQSFSSTDILPHIYEQWNKWERVREIKRKPIVNIKSCYRGSSHLLYVSAFTVMKDSIIITLITTKLDPARSGATTPIYYPPSRRNSRRTVNYNTW